MQELLQRYFITHKTLSIPGIGSLHFQRHKATFDFSKKVFTAPHCTVVFKHAVATGDKHLYAYISQARHIEKDDAIEQYNQFADALRKELDANKSVQLQGIGTFTETGTGQIIFEPSKPRLAFFPDIIAERVARSTAQAADVPKPNNAIAENKELLVVEQPKEERRRTGIPDDERWWIFALILALIAMGAIFYYYYTNGSLD